MIQFFSWYIAVSIIGWLSLPFVQYLLPHLREKGYAFSRSFGLLLGGFIFWLFTSYHILQNDIGGVLAALLICVVIGFLLTRQNPIEAIRSIWKSERRYVISVEVLFFVLFGLLALLRSANPDITGTEKPMELAFINSILQSKTFPPADPWLAGYSISYYYFGYVITAMMIRLTSVASGIGFNLMVSLVFALTGIGMYGLAYNIINAESMQKWLKKLNPKFIQGQNSSIFLPLLAPLFTLIISNLEGVLEFMHSRGLFWKVGTDGLLVSRFWQWLDIQELTQAPMQPFSWWPSRAGGIIWWRASRVLSDLSLAGNRLEIIDEFPFFSFLLADLHPHVLTLPFATLMMAIVLNLLFSPHEEGFSILGVKILLSRGHFILSTILIGSLVFLNTWDYPVYLILFLAAYFLHFHKDEVGIREKWLYTASLAVLMIFGAYICYLPFFISFASQAGGIIPSFIFSTRGIHFWIMFGVILIPIFGSLAIILFKQRSYSSLGRSTVIVGLIFSIIAIMGLGLGLLITSGGQWVAKLPGSLGSLLRDASSAFLSIQGSDANNLSGLFITAVGRRFSSPGTWITLLLLGIASVTLLYRCWNPSDNLSKSGGEQNPGLIFYILLILMGIVLALVPEFVYLRDQFGWRMNTIFKFYYQAWVLWSLAAALSLSFIWFLLNGRTGLISKLVMIVLIIAGLAYPVIGISSTVRNATLSTLNLDGNAYMRFYNHDEAEAIAWLQEAPYGRILEAVGGSYSNYARVATLSGKPNLLGWPGHESQWRGGSEEMGNRQNDIERVYTTLDWQEARSILQIYDVSYVYVGGLERSSYKLSEEKIMQNLAPVYQNQSVTIYGFSPEGNSP